MAKVCTVTNTGTVCRPAGTPEGFGDAGDLADRVRDLIADAGLTEDDLAARSVYIFYAVDWLTDTSVPVPYSLTFE